MECSSDETDNIEGIANTTQQKNAAQTNDD